jgi:hypothetical protein
MPKKLKKSPQGDFFISFKTNGLKKVTELSVHFVCEPQKCFYICNR